MNEFDLSMIMVDDTSFCETNTKLNLVRYPICYDIEFPLEDFFGIPMKTYDDMYSLLDYFPYYEHIELTCFMPDGREKTLEWDKGDNVYETLKNTVEEYSKKKWNRTAADLLEEEWKGISLSI